MSEQSDATINVNKIFTVSLATLGAIAGALGNAPIAGAAVLAQAALELRRKPQQPLTLDVPPWWTGEPRLQSWQEICSYIENRLPRILEGVQQQLPNMSQTHATSYLTAATIKRLFIEQVIQQLSSSWVGKRQDYYLLADYVTTPLLAKTAEVLKPAIDAARQDALTQWMSNVSDQLNAIQQATAPLTASLATIPTTVLPPDTAQAAVKLAQRQQQQEYIVYISYHKADRVAVMGIVEKLKDHGILPWLDIQEARPGQGRMNQQEAQIRNIPSAAICIGQYGIMREQELETYSFIRQFINRNIPVIPVLLASALPELELPPFLETFTEVDFHYSIPDPLGQLIWGITGERP